MRMFSGSPCSYRGASSRSTSFRLSGTGWLSGSYDRANGLATAEVLDDGPGVPEGLRSQLFEPYTTTKEGGTGLGLTIANQIVSDHSGYIRYHERKPTGSAFVIEFPLR